MVLQETSTLEDELEPEVEAPQPGLLDPIRQQGVVQGGASLLSGMLPTTILAQQWAERTTDGYQLSDVVGGAGDFAKISAYTAPVLGEGMGIHHAAQPDSGWLGKVLGVMSTLGLFGGVMVGSGAAAYGAGHVGRKVQHGMVDRGLIQGPKSQQVRLRDVFKEDPPLYSILGPPPVPNPLKPSFDIPIPRIVATTSNDTLAQISGVAREPMIAATIIPTSGGRSRRAMMSLGESWGEQTFNETASITRLRQSLIGSYRDGGEWAPNNSNAVQADDFIRGLGDDLFEQVPDYAASVGMGMSPAQVRVTAASLEISKFDHLVTPKRGWTHQPKLRLGNGVPAVDKHFKKLMAGKELTDVELAELRGAMVQFAKITMGNGHPELALQDPRMGIAAVYLGKDPSTDRVYLNIAELDARTAGTIDEAEMVRRISTMAMVNPIQLMPMLVNNVTDFFHERVVGRLKELESSVLRPAATHPALKDELVQVVPVSSMKRFGAEVTEDVRELSDDIRGNGIKEALVLEYNPRTGAAVLTDGHKRLAAADMRGLEAVPVKIVRNDALDGPAVPGLKKFKKNVPDVLRPQDIGSGSNPAIRKAPAPFQGIIPESQRSMDRALEWYRIANDDLATAATHIGINHRKLVGVASLMSAGELWEQNIEKAVAAARYMGEHPNASATQLKNHMNNVVGIKSTGEEAKNVVNLLKKSDTEVDQFFTLKMKGPSTLKQPNFVEAILQSSASDLDRHQSLVYGMMTGQIDDYNAKYIFGELDAVPLVADRHAFAIATGASLTPDTRMANNMYRTVQRAYEIASEQIGEVAFPNGSTRKLTPSELQALTWVEWREWKGVTKGYKTYDPETFKNIPAPQNWIHGQGPAHVFRRRILDAATTPLPPAFTHRTLSEVSNPTWRFAKDLTGRVKSGKKKMSSGLGPNVRQIGLSYGLDGLQTQVPPGAQMTGGYGSFGYSPHGQDIRPRQAMIVGDARQFYENVLANDTVTSGKGIGFTGSRVKLANKDKHSQPGLNGEMAISVSAPRLTNHGIKGRDAHRQMSARLTEEGITHEFRPEPQFEGRSTVWIDEDGGQYWSKADVEEAGLNVADMGTQSDKEIRSGAVFVFDDPEMMRRARNFMHSPNPHREAGHTPVAARARQGYMDTWADALELGPVRGVKKELQYRGLATETEGVRSPLDRAQADPVVGRRTADAYEAAPTTMTDADVATYDQMVSEVQAQYQYMTRTMGIEVEVVPTNPYSSPRELAADIRDNNRLKVLSTESTGGHPYMTNEQNDMFRAVHDFFGHTVMGNSFTRHGEEAAYLLHSQMFSEGARGAMHSETMGQNSWLNYSKANRAKARKAVRQGLSYEGDFIDQKAVVLSKELWSNQTLATHPGLLTGSDQGRMIDHVYNEQILDFVMYGNGERVPPGMTEVFEHVYRDNVHAVSHMSTQGDPNAANTARVWVEKDGLYEYFKDSKTGRYGPDGGSHTYIDVHGRLHWDGVAEVVNPQVIDDWARSGMSPPTHPFDVTINGERVSEIAVYLPLEGSDKVQMAIGQTTVPGVDPNRVVVWRVTKRGSAETFKAGGFRSEVEVPDIRGTRRMDPTLQDEMVQFMQRTGWRGGSKRGSRVLGIPEFKVKA